MLLGMAPMDRIAATHRPEGRNDGTQRWRNLAFLHWEVDPAALRALVPASLELDLFETRAYVGVVPFLMRGIAPSWWPRALGFNFHETNVRTYVHRAGKDPGVYFFSLDASSHLAVQAARLGWGLPYYHATMGGGREGDHIRYESVRSGGGGARFACEGVVGEGLGELDPDSIEFFFLERYLLFAERKGRLQRGQVHHAPYPAHELLDTVVLDATGPGSLLHAAGITPLRSTPDFAHASPGVDVEVFGMRDVGE